MSLSHWHFFSPQPKPNLAKLRKMVKAWKLFGKEKESTFEVESSAVLWIQMLSKLIFVLWIPWYYGRWKFNVWKAVVILWNICVGAKNLFSCGAWSNFICTGTVLVVWKKKSVCFLKWILASFYQSSSTYLQKVQRNSDLSNNSGVLYQFIKGAKFRI